MNTAAQVDTYNEEQWKQINGMNGIYLVSNFGRIKNIITNHIRKPYVLPNGYGVVRFFVDGKRNHKYVHRLVAEAFCERPEGCNVVNHIDNNKENNNADNLEWTTQFGNVHHGMKQKRYLKNAIPVIGYKDGKQYEFISINEAARKTGCDSSYISKCCRKIQKSSKGYKWEYAEVA